MGGGEGVHVMCLCAPASPSASFPTRLPHLNLAIRRVHVHVHQAAYHCRHLGRRRLQRGLPRGRPSGQRQRRHRHAAAGRGAAAIDGALAAIAAFPALWRKTRVWVKTRLESKAIKASRRFPHYYQQGTGGRSVRELSSAESVDNLTCSKHGLALGWPLKICPLREI